MERTRTHRRFVRLTAVFAALAMLAAACGDDADDTADVDDDVEDVDTPDDDADEPDDADAPDDDAPDDAAEDDDAPDDAAEDDDAAADGEGRLGELQEAGSVTIGIANEVFAELGIDDVQAEVVDFGALIPGLQAGQFDVIAAGMFITPERAEQVIFADPDYCVSYALAVEEGNPLGLSDFQSVVDEGATLAVLSGAVDEDYADDAGIPADQIELFNDVNDQYEALLAGRVDAVGGTSLTVVEQTEADDSIEATEFFFPEDADGEEVLGCGGFAFDDQELRDAFNDVLDDLQEDGTLLEITTGFGFAEEDVERAADLTVEDLAEE